MQGGGEHYEFPKFVWSPAGGWWSNPRHWKRNTIVIVTVAAAFTIPFVKYSAANEVRLSGVFCIVL